MWKNSKNMGISRQNILVHQQFLAKYFENDYWLKNGTQLADQLKNSQLVLPLYPVQVKPATDKDEITLKVGSQNWKFVFKKDQSGKILISELKIE